jgi:hypothetical protein
MVTRKANAEESAAIVQLEKEVCKIPFTSSFVAVKHVNLAVIITLLLKTMINSLEAAKIYF